MEFTFIPAEKRLSVRDTLVSQRLPQLWRKRAPRSIARRSPSASTGRRAGLPLMSYSSGGPLVEDLLVISQPVLFFVLTALLGEQALTVADFAASRFAEPSLPGKPNCRVRWNKIIQRESSKVKSTTNTLRRFCRISSTLMVLLLTRARFCSLRLRITASRTAKPTRFQQHLCCPTAIGRASFA